jgi:hypothetical protein
MIVVKCFFKNAATDWPLLTDVSPYFLPPTLGREEMRDPCRKNTHGSGNTSIARFPIEDIRSC